MSRISEMRRLMLEKILEDLHFAPMNQDELAQRKRPPHLASRSFGNQSTIQFVTVCTDQRQKVLAAAEVHQCLLDAWREADAYLVGRYVLMPDHIHLFCAPNRYPETELKRWIRYWKSLVARRFPFELQGKLWQREFWDRQLRSGDSYSEKWAYVDANPVRAGLASETRQWPYAGEMVQLAWHD
jgi:putative transposase